MGALKSLAAILLLLAARRASAEEVTQWQPYIAEASARFGVPQAWIERVMRAESAGRTRLGGHPITSSAGAMGLMQLMPGTWAEMRSVLGLGRNPHDPRDNILAGTYYLRLMHDRFGYPGCFAAYNAGPARYAAYLGNRLRLPAETVAYVRAIAGPMPAYPAPAPPAPQVAVSIGPPPKFVPARPAAGAIFFPLSRDR